MFSVITNIYNKKTKGLTLMKFFTATGKLKNVTVDTRRSFFWWYCNRLSSGFGRLGVACWLLVPNFKAFECVWYVVTLILFIWILL